MLFVVGGFILFVFCFCFKLLPSASFAPSFSLSDTGFCAVGRDLLGISSANHSFPVVAQLFQDKGISYSHNKFSIKKKLGIYNLVFMEEK